MDSGLPDPADLQNQKLVSKYQELQNQETRANADPALAARLTAYRDEQRAAGGAAISAVARAKAETAKSDLHQDDEKLLSNETRNAEPIRNASVRYAQALGMHYNILDPYASLARAAMAEHADFRSDRERLDRQIAQAANPEVRRALEMRKDIEKAEYVALTSDRIARQSYVITGNKGPGSEFDKFTKQAEYNRQQATELRRQWRGLTQPEQERAPSAERPAAQPVPARDAADPNRSADLKKAPATAPANEQNAERQRTVDQQNQQQRRRARGPRM